MKLLPYSYRTFFQRPRKLPFYLLLDEFWNFIIICKIKIIILQGIWHNYDTVKEQLSCWNFSPREIYFHIKHCYYWLWNVGALGLGSIHVIGKFQQFHSFFIEPTWPEFYQSHLQLFCNNYLYLLVLFSVEADIGTIVQQGNVDLVSFVWCK